MTAEVHSFVLLSIFNIKENFDSDIGKRTAWVFFSPKEVSNEEKQSWKLETKTTQDNVCELRKHRKCTEGGKTDSLSLEVL